MREHRHALYVLRPAQRSDENLRLAHVNRLERVQQGVEERPLVFPEGRVEVMRERLLPGSATQAPGERFDIPRCRGGMRERARVLVDPESEHGGLERRHRDLSLGEDTHERRREGSVGRVHPARSSSSPAWWSKTTMSTSGRRATSSSSPSREGSDASTMINLLTADVEPRGLDETELVLVKAAELANVPVQRSRQRHGGPGG